MMMIDAVALAKQDLPRGLFINECKEGDVIEFDTRNSTYTLVVQKPVDRTVMLASTNPDYAGPAIVQFPGSTWGGSMLKIGYIGVGMFAEFPNFNYLDKGPVSTSEVQDIRLNGKTL